MSLLYYHWICLMYLRILYSSCGNFDNDKHAFLLQTVVFVHYCVLCTITFGFNNLGPVFLWAIYCRTVTDMSGLYFINFWVDCLSKRATVFVKSIHTTEYVVTLSFLYTLSTRYEIILTPNKRWTRVLISCLCDVIKSYKNWLNITWFVTSIGYVISYLLSLQLITLSTTLIMAAFAMFDVMTRNTSVWMQFPANFNIQL